MRQVHGWWLVALAAACGGDGSAAGDGSASDGSASDGSTSDGSTSDGAHQDGSPADGAPDDAGATMTAEACFAGLEPADTGWLEVQRFRSDDGALTVWRARQRIDEPTVGETTAYALVRAWVAGEGEPGACVTDAAALDYTYAHHNWNETWRVSTARATFVGKELFVNDGTTAWTDTLTIEDSAGNVVKGPIVLREDGCWSKPYDLNVCVLRMRSDEPPPGWGE